MDCPFPYLLAEQNNGRGVEITLCELLLIGKTGEAFFGGIIAFYGEYRS
tara:strand:+ start:5365 stop:5511 length:147 start_codon:yes stop_codon:yes gene_type:complete